MEYWCHNCLRSCGVWKQCIDYEFATKEQIKINLEEKKQIASSVCDISEYDESDALLRAMLSRKSILDK